MSPGRIESELAIALMLNKRFPADQVLVDQPWIHEASKSVGEVLGEQGAEVLEFERLQLG